MAHRYNLDTLLPRIQLEEVFRGSDRRLGWP
jgi:hypothetical protein